MCDRINNFGMFLDDLGVFNIPVVGFIVEQILDLFWAIFGCG